MGRGASWLEPPILVQPMQFLHSMQKKPYPWPCPESSRRWTAYRYRVGGFSTNILPIPQYPPFPSGSLHGCLVFLHRLSSACAAYFPRPSRNSVSSAPMSCVEPHCDFSALMHHEETKTQVRSKGKHRGSYRWSVWDLPSPPLPDG